MTRTTTDHAARAVEFFDLLSKREIGRWVEMWHDDARIDVPYPPDGFPKVIEGKQSIASGFSALFENFVRFEAHVVEVYAAPRSDAVIVEYRNDATLLNGTRYTNDNIAVFRFVDGLITEYHDYFDPRRFQAVVDAMRAE